MKFVALALLAYVGMSFDVKQIPTDQIISQAKKIPADLIINSAKCIEKKCSSEWSNYKKDHAILQACSNNCKKNQACWEECAKVDATKAAIQVTLCAQKNNCLPPDAEDGVDDAECFQTHCPDEWNAMKNDPDLPELESCYKKCGQKEQCWTFCLPGKVRKNLIDSAKCAKKNKCTVFPSSK